MPGAPKGLQIEDGDVLLMVGTTKGAFLLRSRPDHRAEAAAWEADGPHFPGEDVYALAFDQRACRRTLWAAPGNALDVDSARPAGVYFGTRSGKLYASADDGDSWTLLRDGLPPVVCVKSAVVGAA